MLKVFISDIHLSEQRPDLIRAFEQFLKHPDLQRCTELYILGDLFEFWIGDDHIPPWIENIQRLLSEFCQHRPSYFLAGNRDFAVGTHFLNQCHLTAIKDNHQLKLAEAQLLLQHGDLLCWQDVGYLRLRKVLRNPIILSLLKTLPVTLRLRLARSLRTQSNYSMQKKSNTMIDASQDAVDYYCKKHQCQHILHGHTHRHKQHTWINHSQRTTLGDWGEHISYAYIDQSNTLKLAQKASNNFNQQALFD